MRAGVAKNAPRTWREVVLDPQRLSPLFWLALIVICLLAVLSGYQVSFSLHEGFRFEPAAAQTAVQKTHRALASACLPLTVHCRVDHDHS
jgi:hypothetical protein